LFLKQGPEAVSAKKKGPKIPRHGTPVRTAKDFNPFPSSKEKGQRISSRNVEFLIMNKMYQKKTYRKRKKRAEGE
jgi:hypothetical protein